MTDHYDVAILGGGLAGLSLLYHLIKEGALGKRRVLLVDPQGRKSGHDRSWSYWERGHGPFDELVYHRWDRVSLHNRRTDLHCQLSPYAYKLIRSTEFYAHVNEIIDNCRLVERMVSKATDIEQRDQKVQFTAGGRRHSANMAFSSLPLHLRPRQLSQPYLDQHFRGWFINTDADVFDPGCAALMDFRTPQRGETRFFYVLPFSKRRAMVEIAIFSNNHLAREEYDRLIATYIRDHWTRGNYEIEHDEAGNIPMTTYPFPVREGNLVYIGLRGGAARPSTGYTFYGLQRQLRQLARAFPSTVPAPWRARDLLYDATILRILQDGQLPGDEVFVDLFASNPPSRVLSFLNGESNLVQELRLMATTKIGVFGKSFVKGVFA